MYIAIMICIFLAVFFAGAGLGSYFQVLRMRKVVDEESNLTVELPSKDSFSSRSNVTYGPLISENSVDEDSLSSDGDKKYSSIMSKLG